MRSEGPNLAIAVHKKRGHPSTGQKEDSHVRMEAGSGITVPEKRGYQGFLEARGISKGLLSKDLGGHMALPTLDSGLPSSSR
jgi:hypothetical protein